MVRRRAHKMSPEMIKEYLGVDSLNYLSLEATIRATGMPASDLSTSCFDGVYPIPIGKREESKITHTAPARA